MSTPMPMSSTRLRRLMPRLAAAFVLVAAPCFSAPIPPERALLARGEYEKAITQLESVLAKEPTRSDAAQALLECFLAVGRYKDAVDRGTAFLARQQDARVAARLADALNRI